MQTHFIKIKIRDYSRQDNNYYSNNYFCCDEYIVYSKHNNKELEIKIEEELQDFQSNKLNPIDIINHLKKQGYIEYVRPDTMIELHINKNYEDEIVHKLGVRT